MKRMAYKLKGGASAWWEQLQYNRQRQGKQRVRTWPKMKRLLQQRFLPPDYEQFLYQQYQNCRQTNRPVNEYTEEFYRLNARVNLSETEDQLIAHYIGSLKLAIQDRLALQGVWTMTDVVNLAMKVENQINRSSTRTLNNFRRPTQEAFSTPKESTISSSNENNNKDVPSTHSSTKNR